MDAILQIARDHDLLVIEDAAHAFGSLYAGSPVGANSYAACFSFGPIKNITCGEGGGIATGDEELATRLRLYRNMGFERNTWERFSSVGNVEQLPSQGHVISSGDRCHLSDVKAAIGLAQLCKLETFKRRRREILTAYESAFSDVADIRLLTTDPVEDFLCIFPIRVLTGRRDEFMRKMLGCGFHVTIHYEPCHMQPYFRRFSAEPLAVAERVGSQLVSIPSFIDMTDEQVCTVIDAVRECISATR